MHPAPTETIEDLQQKLAEMTSRRNDMELELDDLNTAIEVHEAAIIHDDPECWQDFVRCMTRGRDPISWKLRSEEFRSGFIDFITTVENRLRARFAAQPQHVEGMAGAIANKLIWQYLFEENRDAKLELRQGQFPLAAYGLDEAMRRAKQYIAATIRAELERQQEGSVKKT